MKTLKIALYFLLLLCTTLGQSYAQTSAFITTWKTDNSGTSNSTSITIPTSPLATYNYDVDWNDDGIYDQHDIAGDVTHDFGTAGTYTIRIRGAFPWIKFNAAGDCEKIMSIDQWGTIAWESMENAFHGCTNLTSGAADIPDLSNVTSLYSTFRYAENFNGNLLDMWDVSNVTNMFETFYGAHIFNQNIGDWRVSKVTNMQGMFAFTHEFNQDLGNWNVWKVTNMKQVFDGADAFNQDISRWDVGQVTDMSMMFHFSQLFNQDISSWDVSKVTNMSKMFKGALVFDKNIGDWDITAVSDMTAMFDDCSLTTATYDKILIAWAGKSVQSNVTFGAKDQKYCLGTEARLLLAANHSWTFIGDTKHCPLPFTTTWKTDNSGTSNATSITIPTYAGLGLTYYYDVDWDNDGVFDELEITGDVTHDFGTVGTYTIRIRGAFPGIFFNYTGDAEKITNINQWGESRLREMSFAFAGCSNMTCTAVDTPNLFRLKGMYAAFADASLFNGDLSAWDVQSAEDMGMMFYGATSFNGDLSNWEPFNLVYMDYMFAFATAFNQNINTWDVKDVTTMNSTFWNASAFNQPVYSWEVDNVTDMLGMFENASAFDQSLKLWDIGNVTDMQYMLDNSGLSRSNYDETLTEWKNQGISNITLGANGLKYCASETARNSLINTYGWTITGDSKDCSGSTRSIQVSNGKRPARIFSDLATYRATRMHTSQPALNTTVSTAPNLDLFPSTAAEAQLDVFPNPSPSKINISIQNPSEKDMKIQLTDNLGRKIWATQITEASSSWDQNLQLEKSGAYFISVQIGEQVISKKVLIIK